MRHKLTITAALSLIGAMVGYAEEAAWRPAPGVVAPASVRGQSPEQAPRVTIGIPRPRLGAPRVRAEQAASAEPSVQPTLFTAPSKAIPLPPDAAAKPEAGKTEVKPEPVPPPRPDVSSLSFGAAGKPAPTAPTPAPAQSGLPLAMPGTAEGSVGQQPEGYIAPRPSSGSVLPPAAGVSVIMPPFGTPPCEACGEGMPFGCMVEGVHGPMSKVYMNFEFLLWTLKADQAPALVTTGPQNSGGILGQNGVSVLVGGNLEQQPFFGGRVQLGAWFDPCERFGMVGSFFMLQQRTKTYSNSSDGNPLLARPFFNPLEGGFQDSELVAAEELLRGSVTVKNQTQLLGADLNFRWNLAHRMWEKNCSWKSWNLDLIAGVRYLRLNESLTINEDLTDGPAGQDPGARTFIQDRFETENNFYGGQIGLLTEMRYKGWFVNLSAKVALGATQQRVGISGSSTFDLTDAPAVTQPAGILAGQTNIGNYSRTAFSIVPEIGVNLGYQLTDHCRVYVGYNLLVWTNVVRPGQQIDPVVNPNNWPSNVDPGRREPPQRPAFTYRDSTFWAQGLVAGLEWRF